MLTLIIPGTTPEQLAAGLQRTQVGSLRLYSAHRHDWRRRRKKMMHCSCKFALRPLFLSAFLVLQAAMPAAAVAGGWPTVTPLAPMLRIVDANGSVFGRFGGYDYNPRAAIVYIPTSRGTAAVALYAGGSSAQLAFGHQSLYFEQANCVGTAYIDGTALVGALPAVVLTRFDGTNPLLYVADGYDATGSGAESQYVDGGCSSFGPYSTGPLFPVTTHPISLSTMFTPPFRMQ